MACSGVLEIDSNRLASPGAERAPAQNVGIFSCCTPSYLKHAHALIGSWLGSGNGQIPLHLAAINLRDRELRELRRVPNLHVLPVSHAGASLRDWVVCWRFGAFRDLLAATNYDSMLFLDCDALLLRPLAPEWTVALAGAHVALHERAGEQLPRYRVYGGHIFVARTAGGLAFLDAAVRHIERLGFAAFNDQHAAYLALLEARGAGLPVNQLDPRLVDTTTRADASIWAGKGVRGRTRWRYLREAMRGRRRFRALVAAHS